MKKEDSIESKRIENKNTKKPLDVFIQMKKDNRWKVFGQVAFVTLSSLFIFGGIGWLLDTWVRGHGHAFLITFLILSYPVTQFALYRKMKNFNLNKK